VPVVAGPIETVRIGHGFGQFLNKAPKGNNGSVMAWGFSSLKTPIASLVRLADLTQVACVIASPPVDQSTTNWTKTVQQQEQKGPGAAFCSSLHSV
jgi:hypothetical protein